MKQKKRTSKEVEIVMSTERGIFLRDIRDGIKEQNEKYRKEIDINKLFIATLEQELEKENFKYKQKNKG